MTRKGAYRHPGSRKAPVLPMMTEWPPRSKTKGLPRQPLIAQYYVNLSANSLKLPLTEPLSAKDETTLNVFYGKYKFISQDRVSYDHRPSSESDTA